MTNERKKLVEKEIEATLRCLGEVETIEAGPHFYTRLMARIESHKAGRIPVPRGLFAWGPLRPAFLALLVALNAFSVVWLFQTGESRPEAGDDSIEAFASAYSLYEDNNGA